MIHQKNTMKHRLVLLLLILPMQIFSVSIWELARNAEYQEIKRLVQINPDYVNLLEPETGKTMLHYALRNNTNFPLFNLKKEKLTHFLIKKGANVLQADANGDTPLKMATFHGSTTNRKLIFQQIDITDQQYLNFLLLQLCETDHREAECIDILLTRGADPNTRDAKGRTPLMLCNDTCFNAPLATEVLLQHGANANAYHFVNQKTRDILWYAVRSGDLKSINTLLKYGAKVSHQHVKLAHKWRLAYYHSDQMIQLLKNKLNEQSSFGHKPTTNELTIYKFDPHIVLTEDLD